MALEPSPELAVITRVDHDIRAPEGWSDIVEDGLCLWLQSEGAMLRRRMARWRWFMIVEKLRAFESDGRTSVA